MAKRILLLASGTGSLAAAILGAIAADEISLECVGLISDKESKALEVAREYGVEPIFIPMREKRAEWDREIFGRVQALAPELVVSVGFMRLLSAEFVDAFRTINTHPSMLPAFPGAHAVRDALAAGVQKTGTTVHWVDAGLDTGEVISQRELAIETGEDESTLHERIKIVERALIVETLAAYGRTGEL